MQCNMAVSSVKKHCKSIQVGAVTKTPQLTFCNFDHQGKSGVSVFPELSLTPLSSTDDMKSNLSTKVAPIRSQAFVSTKGMSC
eukprot:IDg9722t1